MPRSNKIGGLDAIGTHKTDNMYHAGWAWAGNTPLKSTKLVAAHFGGTRSPMAISWPAKIKPDSAPRAQFHHVNDIAPTLYELIGIKPPKVVNGYKQDQIDGISMAYTLGDAKAPTRKKVQYFENSGSRGIYKDGWFAGSVRAVRSLGFGRLQRRHGQMGCQPGPVGALQPERRLLAGARSGRPRTRRSWPS